MKIIETALDYGFTQLDYGFKQLDTDNSGGLDRKELASVIGEGINKEELKKKANTAIKSAASAALNFVDEDNSKDISTTELDQALTNIGKNWDNGRSVIEERAARVAYMSTILLKLIHETTATSGGIVAGNKLAADIKSPNGLHESYYNYDPAADEYLNYADFK